MGFYIILGAFFIAIGLAIHKFKCYFLISGYNTMPKEKKQKVNTDSLGRLMGIYSYINGVSLIFVGILAGFGIKSAQLPYMLLFVASTIYLLIKAQRYDKNIFDENGKLIKGAGKNLILPIGIIAVVVIFVGVLMLFSVQPTKVTFFQDYIQIHGMYGEEYQWNTIEKVSIIEELPTIEMRTNGSALGSNLKGYFRTKDKKIVKLFVNTSKPPYIIMETKYGIIIFNLKDKENTTIAYEAIINQIGKK